MDEINKAMQRPLIFIMSDNTPNFSYRKKCRRSSLSHLQDEGKERKKEEKKLSAGYRGPKHEFSLFLIYYAFRFKKKNTSTAEHKHNAASTLSILEYPMS